MWVKDHTHTLYSINFDKLVELNQSDPALFAWSIQYITDMSFIEHEDKMDLFKNIKHISDFVITNKDGALNRSIFTKLSPFSQVTQMSFICYDNGQVIPQGTSNTLTIDETADQLPQSLESVVIYGIGLVKWDDFEPFMETLVTSRPTLKIEINGSTSVLEGRSRMMELVNSGRITTK